MEPTKGKVPRWKNHLSWEALCAKIKYFYVRCSNLQGLQSVFSKSRGKKVLKSSKIHPETKSRGKDSLRQRRWRSGLLHFVQWSLYLCQRHRCSGLLLASLRRDPYICAKGTVLNYLECVPTSHTICFTAPALTKASFWRAVSLKQKCPIRAFQIIAESEGFEPPVRGCVHRISSAAL